MTLCLLCAWTKVNEGVTGVVSERSAALRTMLRRRSAANCCSERLKAPWSSNMYLYTSSQLRFNNAVCICCRPCRLCKHAVA